MLRSIQPEGYALPIPNVLKAGLLRPAAAAAMLFLLMHAPLAMNASPLAIAMMGVGLAAGIHPAAVVSGCLLGMLRLPLTDISILNAVGCLLLVGFELAAALLPALKQKCTSPACTAFLCGLACMLPAMVQAGGDALQSLKAFSCGALAAASAPFITAALELNRSRKRLSMDEKCGCALLLAGCTAGLQQICPPAAEFASLLAVLLLPGFTPGAGILAGLGLRMGGGETAKLASLALCGLFSAGRLLKEGWQRSIVVCASAVLARLMLGPSALDLRWTLCAAAAYPLLPGMWTARLEEISAPQREKGCDPDRIARETAAGEKRRLNALADAFSIMAECAPACTDVPDEQALIQEMRTRLCAGCIHYGDCWAGGDNRAVHLLCRLIGEALERTDAPQGMRILFSDGDVPPDILRICRRGRMIPDRLGLLLRDFAQKRRSEIKRCENNQVLSLQLMQAGQILRDLASQSAVSGNSSRLQSALEGAGLCFCETLPLPGGGFAIVKPENWSREEACRALSAAARRLNARFLPRIDGTTLRLLRAGRLHAETAASCQSGIAGEICGDSHILRMLDEGRLMMAVSDGMGSGEAASAQSRETLRLLWNFLDAGISRRVALETVNRQLLMGSGEDIFSTIDLCIIDLNSGIAEFTKLAACRTLLLREGEILRIEGGHLPLGILENVQPGFSRVRLKPGDMLVMGSDGVMEAGDCAMAERFLQENAALSPDEMARQLVRQAALCRESRHRDDLTCICAKIRGG